MRTLLVMVLALCLLAGRASGQSVYKCRLADGRVVYQSTACDGVIEKQWTPAPASSPDAAQARAAAERSIERDRQWLKASNRPATIPRVRRGAPRSTRSTADPCERARLARAAAHERRGVRWSFDDASKWDARVFKVCR